MYVKSYVNNDLVAEDIVSESLIKLWEHLKIENIGYVAPLLFTILRNNTLDHLRKEKIRKKAYDGLNKLLYRDLEIKLSTIEATDPEFIFSTEVSRIIHETINALPARTRKIFILSRYDGIPYKEIAQKLKISVKGVDYHIFQVMNKLRISLRDYLMSFFIFFLFF